MPSTGHATMNLLYKLHLFSQWIVNHFHQASFHNKQTKKKYTKNHERLLKTKVYKRPEVR